MGGLPGEALFSGLEQSDHGKRKPATVKGETTMSLKITAAAALAGGAMLLAGAPARAQGYEYPYCTSGGWATDNICQFRTFEECMTFVQGVGGSCTRNPRVAQYPQAIQGSMRQRR
jgi:Protein of unknown function (DUF3551)